MTAALVARSLTKRLGGALVVDDVDLVAESGQITVVVGPNGAGKTTLFNCLAGTDPADSGSVLHNGEDVTGWTPDRLVHHGLARTFQRSSVFATMTVADNLRVAAEHRHGGVLWQRRHSRQAVEQSSERVVARVIADLGLRGVAGLRAAGLPTGTLRLVELGRALCSEPDTLLLDEPASGLDDHETERFHGVLRRLAGRGLAVLMIEHDLGLVHDAADAVAVMVAGRVIASGPAAATLQRPDVHPLLVGGAT